jgi:short-chain fatty acids transporter
LWGAWAKGKWGLDEINAACLGLGLVLHAGPSGYVRAVTDGARGGAGILLQFPLYFGVLGILLTSGLVGQVARWFVALGSESGMVLGTFLSAALINLFIPSGGGQWAVQGPVVMEAAVTLGVEPGRAVMALSYGDAWSNMLQPFWALPLLGTMGLEARQIVGYTAALMCVTGPIIAVCLVWL